MDNFGLRLRQARRAAALSLRELASQVGVSQTAILKVEQGELFPSSDLLLALSRALGIEVDRLFRPFTVSLSQLRFRRSAPFGEKLYRAIEQQVVDQLERRLEFEALTPAPSAPFDGSFLPERVASLDEVEALAERVREVWGVGSAPLSRLIDLFESRGVRVVAVDLDESRFDGLFALAGELPILVLNRSWPGDRQRFSLAHELAHLLLRDRIEPGLDEESACNRFAGAFLFPKEAVVSWFGRHRRQIEWRELLLAKEEYGISMQAIVHRLTELSLVGVAYGRKLASEFRRRGWREREPGPQYPAERPHLFEQMVLHALNEGHFGESKAAELLNLSVHELRAARSIDES